MRELYRDVCKAYGTLGPLKRLLRYSERTRPCSFLFALATENANYPTFSNGEKTKWPLLHILNDRDITLSWISCLRSMGQVHLSFSLWYYLGESEVIERWLWYSCNFWLFPLFAAKRANVPEIYGGKASRLVYVVDYGCWLLVMNSILQMVSRLGVCIFTKGAEEDLHQGFSVNYLGEDKILVKIC